MANLFDFTSQTIRGNQEARRQRAEFEDLFLSGFRVPEQATQSILNTKRNRFGIEELEQNFDTDLETSRLNSQLANRTAQENLDTFDERSALAALERDFAFEQNKGRIGKLTADNAFNSLLDEMAPIKETAAKHDYYTTLFDRIEESTASESVKQSMRTRAKTQFVQEYRPQLKVIEDLDLLLLESQAAQSQGSNISSNKRARITSLVKKLDADLLNTAIAEGILNEADIPDNIARILELNDTGGSIDALGVEEGDGPINPVEGPIPEPEPAPEPIPEPIPEPEVQSKFTNPFLQEFFNLPEQAQFNTDIQNSSLNDVQAETVGAFIAGGETAFTLLNRDQQINTIAVMQNLAEQLTLGQSVLLERLLIDIERFTQLISDETVEEPNARQLSRRGR